MSIRHIYKSACIGSSHFLLALFFLRGIVTKQKFTERNIMVSNFFIKTQNYALGFRHLSLQKCVCFSAVKNWGIKYICCKSDDGWQAHPCFTMWMYRRELWIMYAFAALNSSCWPVEKYIEVALWISLTLEQCPLYVVSKSQQCWHLQEISFDAPCALIYIIFTSAAERNFIIERDYIFWPFLQNKLKATVILGNRNLSFWCQRVYGLTRAVDQKQILILYLSHFMNCFR